MTIDLPDGLKPYKRTATFSEATVPAGLLEDHSTKSGVWGLIHVEEGALRYVVTDPRRASIERVLTPTEQPGVVEPTILHRIELLGPVLFHVEFLQARHSASETPRVHNHNRRES